MKKKIVSLILASVMAVTGLIGCGSTKTASTSGQDTTSSSGKDVHITYALWDSNQAKGIRTMADEFEAKNPGIKIDLQVVGWDNYWTMLEAAATGGSLPDTFWMHSNEIYRYESNGMLMDLTDRINKSSEVKLSNYPEGLDKIYNLNNKQYAIPKDYDTIGLWYNKTMFDKAGISYPDETWNWDKLYEAAKKLTTGDGKQYGFLAPLHNQEGYYNFVYQNGGTIITDDKVSGYDNPKTIEAMKFYVKFVQDGLSPKIFGDAERAEAMQNGLCAMGLFGSWNLSGFTSNDYMSKNFNVAVLPSANDGKRASIFNGLGNAISATTKHPEEAWKWVEYLSSKEGQTRQAELGIAISAYNGTADAWVNSNKTFNIKCFIDMVKYAQIRPYSNNTAKWEDKAYELLKGSFTGEKTVEDACKDTAQMMNDALKEEK
ncbi:extracellular solute-binding protein family 1 [Clostridium sp. DL-VIII]|uniref:ABC transporter substrate-binding protein n=1 Tax=Clostridium sp. DL-VIII TaxID=641107 RepID=UPI00023AFE22|nr:sugar ABC transporter substrate-binding protein [Clostridium sp. DL-VIII]EHI99660.1 extracellular solute-binding protein family 1 [Clostridium sp. DL-VIII]